LSVGPTATAGVMRRLAKAAPIDFSPSLDSTAHPLEIARGI